MDACAYVSARASCATCAVARPVQVVPHAQLGRVNLPQVDADTGLPMGQPVLLQLPNVAAKCATGVRAAAHRAGSAASSWPCGFGGKSGAIYLSSHKSPQAHRVSCQQLSQHTRQLHQHQQHT